ncbi:unnamed protein product, partial [Mesorhabditis spiculigera]
MTTERTVVQENILHILERVQGAATDTAKTPRLVAVSKTKPADLIKECYDVGQRHFGENYVQELEEKGSVFKDLPDIRWHYIGQVQSNKIPKICAVPNLYCVETVDNEKHAQLFEKEMGKRERKLNILIQVNTSGEDQKGGVEPEGVVGLGRFIRENCTHLEIAGFMTIGSIAGSSKTPNPDFDKLVAVRKEFARVFEDPEDQYELSMGMSDDFETAIQQGSTSVRVGSKIFGPRLYKK